MSESKQQFEGWNRLESDERSSTVSNFVCGWEDGDGLEVLIWKGVEHEDGIWLESSGYEEVPEGAEYVIEVMMDSTVINANYTDDEEEAKRRAKMQVVSLNTRKEHTN